MSAGKGDKPRNCFSKTFKDNYENLKVMLGLSFDIPNLMSKNLKEEKKVFD